MVPVLDVGEQCRQNLDQISGRGYRLLVAGVNDQMTLFADALAGSRDVRLGAGDFPS
jgi:hypothetical protein